MGVVRDGRPPRLLYLHKYYIQIKETVMETEEVFKDIIGRPGYQVSNLGRVKSNKRKNPYILSEHVNRLGFVEVQVFCHSKASFINVAREVLAAFCGYPAEPWLCVARHLNGDLTDCRLENLAWVVCQTDDTYDPKKSKRRGVLKPEHTKEKMSESKLHQDPNTIEKAVATRVRSMNYRRMFKNVNAKGLTERQVEDMKDIYSIHNRLNNGK